MTGDKRSSWRKSREAERNRNLLMVLILVIVIILIVVIVIVDRSKGTDDKVETNQTGEQTPEQTSDSIADLTEPDTDITDETMASTTAAQTQAAETSAYVMSQMLKDENPAINDLIETYFAARVDCDAETIYKLYGRTDTNGIEEFRAKMLYNARYIESFEHIVCYTTAAVEENSWLVYISTDIKFRSAATPAPSGVWCYVVQDEEGNLKIIDSDNYTPEQQALAEKVKTTEDVRNISLQIDTRLREALQTDPELLSIYGTLNAGSPIWQDSETEPETEQEVQVLPE